MLKIISGWKNTFVTMVIETNINSSAQKTSYFLKDNSSHFLRDNFRVEEYFRNDKDVRT